MIRQTYKPFYERIKWISQGSGSDIGYLSNKVPSVSNHESIHNDPSLLPLLLLLLQQILTKTELKIAQILYYESRGFLSYENRQHTNYQFTRTYIQAIASSVHVKLDGLLSQNDFIIGKFSRAASKDTKG